MPNLAINGAVNTQVYWAAYQQTSCTMSVSALGNANPSGTKYISVYQMRMGVSGRDASRTIALGLWSSGLSLLARTDNFTVAASTSAPQTSYKDLQSAELINTTTTSTIRAGFWVSGKSAVYMQVDESSQSGKDIYYDTTTDSSIANFTDSGTYSFGTDSSLVGNLNYYTLPTAPASLTGVAGQAQVTLNWTAPSDNGGTSVTSYTLQRATNSGFTTGLVTTTGVTGTTLTVTGLTNGTAYYFRIAAVNSVATAASTTGAYRTLSGTLTPTTSATVPGPPTALAFTPSAEKTSIDLSWTAPASNGGAAITQYSIRYTPFGSATTTTVLTGSTSTSFTLTGLSTNTSFTIDVAAVNSVGTGAYSASVEGYTVFLSSELGLIKRYDSVAGGWRVLV